MKQKIFIGPILLLLIATAAMAQNNTATNLQKVITCDKPAESAFYNTIDYLQENGYFITSLNKATGFILAKLYIKNKKMISTKIGERRTLSFIIFPITQDQSTISLNVYEEELTYNSNHAHYYEDKGISNNKETYETILKGLKEHLLK